MRGLAVATNIDPADVANQDDVHMVATLDGKLIIAGYDRLGDLVRIQETDPINYHIAWDVIEESSMGTAASPFVYYLDLDTYYRMSLQIDVTLGTAAAGGVALTTLGTVEDDDPDLTARNYVDMTNAWTGSPSITVDAILTGAGRDIDLAGVACRLFVRGIHVDRLTNYLRYARPEATDCYERTAFPAAIAIGANHRGPITGTLKGEMTPTTPSGCLIE
jgi:hypothetical protein